MSKADSLTPNQIKRVLRTCAIMQHGQAKATAIVLSHAAMRVSEIARLDVKTILYPSGQLRDEVHLPARICKGLKPRTIWLTNTTAREVVQQWIDYRKAKRWGLSLDPDRYQGLNASAPFILNNRGASYSLQPKPRATESGMVDYWCCDSLEQAIRYLYRRCGFPNCSSHTGRKSLVTNGVIAGVELGQLARVLGHADEEMTLRYVVPQCVRLKALCAEDWI